MSWHLQFREETLTGSSYFQQEPFITPTIKDHVSTVEIEILLDSIRCLAEIHDGINGIQSFHRHDGLLKIFFVDEPDRLDHCWSYRYITGSIMLFGFENVPYWDDSMELPSAKHGIL